MGYTEPAFKKKFSLGCLKKEQLKWASFALQQWRCPAQWGAGKTGQRGTGPKDAPLLPLFLSDVIVHGKNCLKNKIKILSQKTSKRELVLQIWDARAKET